MTEEQFWIWVKDRWDEQEARENKNLKLSKDPIYLAASLMGEAAEVWDTIKKPYRAEDLSKLDRKALILELGDTYHYFMKLCQFFDISLDSIREANVNKLENRDECR